MFIKQRNKLFKLKTPRSLKLVYAWGKGLGLFSNKNFRKGETVSHFKADKKRSQEPFLQRFSRLLCPLSGGTCVAPRVLERK